MALLLLGGFRVMVDTATTKLAERGHPDVRANHEFAMRAIQGGADSAAAVAGNLGITKQAAAKTIATLEARDYVTRKVDPTDGRRRSLTLTTRGQDMLDQGQAILDDLRNTWSEMIGEERLKQTESVLHTISGGSLDKIDADALLENDYASSL